MLCTMTFRVLVLLMLCTITTRPGLSRDSHGLVVTVQDINSFVSIYVQNWRKYSFTGLKGAHVIIIPDGPRVNISSCTLNIILHPPKIKLKTTTVVPEFVVCC